MNEDIIYNDLDNEQYNIVHPLYIDNDLEFIFYSQQNYYSLYSEKYKVNWLANNKMLIYNRNTGEFLFDLIIPININMFGEIDLNNMRKFSEDIFNNKIDSLLALKAFS